MLGCARAARKSSLPATGATIVTGGGELGKLYALGQGNVSVRTRSIRMGPCAADSTSLC
ncbi:hypothetical protein COLSTE_01376 [Collinsella stercoris DSM 13279]|uniref:Uncharacterized protein n=1 Tax=Collinsella stercoris DSM 13279 TaxID=445975 RepID=B6GBB8_9ACTN|nr:hypothetical protein COLSTE_01376 [Collinsella stercoris DSM 13279]